MKKFNHHKKKYYAKQKELVKRSYWHYISFEDKLAEATQKALNQKIERKRFCCSICYREWKDTAHNKKQRAIKCLHLENLGEDLADLNYKVKLSL